MSDVATIPGREFPHDGLLGSVQVQQGQRHANLVVEAIGGFEHRAPTGQDVGDDLLGLHFREAVGETRNPLKAHKDFVFLHFIISLFLGEVPQVSDTKTALSTNNSERMHILIEFTLQFISETTYREVAKFKAAGRTSKVR